MTPEMTLVQALSGLPTTQQEKTAAAMRELSIDELEAFLRSDGMGKKASRGSDHLLKMADGWGRELARFTKTAFAPPAGMLGQAAGGALRMATRSPLTTRAAVGAGVGAAGGLVSGLSASPNPQTGQSPSVLGRVAMGAAGGAGLAAGARPAAKALLQRQGAAGQYARGALTQANAAAAPARRLAVRGAAAPAVGAAKPAVAPAAPATATPAAPAAAPAAVAQRAPGDAAAQAAADLESRKAAIRGRTGMKSAPAPIPGPVPASMQAAQKQDASGIRGMFSKLTNRGQKKPKA